MAIGYVAFALRVMGQALSILQLPSGSQVLETKVAHVDGLIVDYESSCALEFLRWSSEKKT